MPGRAITGSMLYSLVSCPHRVTMDLFEDPAKRDPVNAFVELLWERGSAVERERIAGLQADFVDLQAPNAQDNLLKTSEAMAAGASLIYGGRIAAGDLLGEPDLLRKEIGGYVPGDIKSGAGEEGGGGDDDDEGEGRPKKTYAVQLALYVDILEQLGRSAGRRGFIWDVHGAEITYDLSAPRGSRNPETWWGFYGTQLATARGIVARTATTLPAYASGTCKLCHWYSTCLNAVKAADDLTLIAELGRTKRDAMYDEIKTVKELATITVKA
jgi:predicted RecB family nuclease